MKPEPCLPFCYSVTPSLPDSSLYCTNCLLECPVHLDAVLSRRGHLAGRIVCDSLSRRKAWGILLSGLAATTTTIPLSLRQVEDRLSERGIDICHETDRLWWNRFGVLFAAEIRKRQLTARTRLSNFSNPVDQCMTNF